MNTKTDDKEKIITQLRDSIDILRKLDDELFSLNINMRLLDALSELHEELKIMRQELARKLTIPEETNDE